MLERWLKTIYWEQVAAWSLWGMTLTGCALAILAENHALEWFLGLLVTTTLTRVEHLNKHVAKLLKEKSSD